jgi:hypothetical protein
VALASERVVRKRRRVCIIGIGNFPSVCRSSLQLAFELVKDRHCAAAVDNRHPLGREVRIVIHLAARDRLVDLGARRPVDVSDLGKESGGGFG